MLPQKISHSPLRDDGWTFIFLLKSSPFPGSFRYFSRATPWRICMERNDSLWFKKMIDDWLETDCSIQLLTIGVYTHGIVLFLCIQCTWWMIPWGYAIWCWSLGHFVVRNGFVFFHFNHEYLYRSQTRYQSILIHEILFAHSYRVEGYYNHFIWRNYYNPRNLQQDPLNGPRKKPEYLYSQRKFSWETSDIRTTSQSS